MPITLDRKRRGGQKSLLTVETFQGIDKSTGRHRIEGDGIRLYEAQNTFPYIMGRLQRRRDYTNTNSRTNTAFPAFPTQSLSGSPLVKKIVEYSNEICIFYEDDGDAGKLLMDSINIGSNTITARITKTSDGGGAYTFTSGGLVDAVSYVFDTGGAGTWTRFLIVAMEGNHCIQITEAWAITDFDASVNTCNGVAEVFNQALFVARKGTGVDQVISRTGPANGAFQVTYAMSEDVGDVIRMVSFGYQTSSVGAYTNLIIFKPTSTWLMTGIASTAVIEQVSGNVGLVGKDAVVKTPFGLVFMGRDSRGFVNLYLLDRTSLTLHTIGHPLYEVFQLIPRANYEHIVVSYDRNRLVRIALTQAGDSNINEKEYWVDFYNGVKHRTFWGPFPLKIRSLLHAIEFSGGDTPANGGFFFLEKISDTDYKLMEDSNSTDGYDSTYPNADDQVIRTKIFDWGTKYALIPLIWVTALANGAKFKVYTEVPKTGGTDNDTTQTLAGPGSSGTTGEYQMGTTGVYKAVPIRLTPAIRVNQMGIKIVSDYDATDNNPLEISQIGFEFIETNRSIIE